MATDTPRLPTSTPAASSPSSRLGTDALLFFDEFDDETSGWPTGEGMGAAVGYIDGALFVGATDDLPGGPFTPSRPLGESFDTIRFAALVQPEAGSEGVYGVHCQDEDYDFLGGAVTTDGSYLLYRRVAGVDEVIQRHDDPPLSGTDAGSEVLLMVECGVNAQGDAEIYFSVNGEDLLDHTESASALDGIVEFGLYAAAEGSRLSFNVTEATAWVTP
jgi:hypothetical protein